MFKKTLLVVMLILIVPCAGVAGEKNKYEWLTVPNEKAVGLIETVYLVIDDQVKDGCWTNIQEVKNRLRYRLESEGISVSPERFFITSPKNPTIVLSVLGNRFVGRCGVSYSFDVITSAASSTWHKNINVAVEGALPLWGTSGRLTSAVDGKSNAQLIEKANFLMDSFLADVLSARKDPKVIEAKRRCFDNVGLITMKQYEKWLNDMKKEGQKK